jgi:hypothetical protein
MRFLFSFGRFWYDFIVGDDWRIAAGVGFVLGVGAALVAETGLSDAVVSVVMMAGVVTVVATAVLTSSEASADP